MKILLGVTGSIAAYKSIELIRLLRADNHEVQVVLSRGAKAFITPLTFQTISGRPVRTALFDATDEAAMDHITLAKWPDCILIAPASANCIANLAAGKADELLSTLVLASTAPLFIAPAMNQQMWLNPITQSNVHRLIKHSATLLGPDVGLQACGDDGPGRLLEPDDLITALMNHLKKDQPLKGRRVVMTAGPTQEAIDPVRYLTNHSSGKMGYAMARAASDAGADVTLISGPTHLAHPKGVQIIRVTTAAQMFVAVMEEMDGCDIFISTAAVADYTITTPTPHKLKKTSDNLTLDFTATKDILASVGALDDKPFILGFAAETQNLIENAEDKLRRKRCDMIAVNQVGLPGSGFQADENALTVISNDGHTSLPLTEKAVLAKQLIKLLCDAYATTRQTL